jgi:hypothetical protein
MNDRTGRTLHAGARRRLYRKRQDQAVTAVQIQLDTDGFSYEKWGANQRCRAGDWLIDNDGDCYTVDAESFARTYRRVSPGRYLKTSCVWAEAATQSGVVSTKEGSTNYSAGDYLVSNDEEGKDAYAVTREKFLSMYDPADDS